MATTAMDYENANGDRFDDDGPRYDRDRSASPRRDDLRNDDRDDGQDSARRRSMSPNGNDRAPVKGETDPKDEGAVNPGSNLFVTGIHPRITEEQVTRLFEKYGEVEKCQIMRDPHSNESRGFGFVKMVTSDMADAAKEGLHGEVIEGRPLSIEKARRARPRTPTPGKYFGPPKREGGRGGRMGGRFDDRRGPRDGYGGGYRDDYRYRGYREDRGYDRNYDRGYDRGGYERPSYREDRGYDRGYDRDDRGSYRGGAGGGGYDRRDRDDGMGRSDRYNNGGAREDRGERFSNGGGRGGGDDRRGGYERERFDRGDRGDRDSRPRDAAPAAGYGDAAPRAEAREAYGPR